MGSTRTDWKGTHLATSDNEAFSFSFPRSWALIRGSGTATHNETRKTTQKEQRKVRGTAQRVVLSTSFEALVSGEAEQKGIGMGGAGWREEEV